MKADKTDGVLDSIDKALSSLPQVTCWRCEKAPGEPSLCLNCHIETKSEGYVGPPKGTTRKPWTNLID